MLKKTLLILYLVCLQTSQAPAEIVLDQLAISDKEYLRVTIRSSQAFRGFVVKAVDILNTDKNGK